MSDPKHMAKTYPETGRVLLFKTELSPRSGSQTLTFSWDELERQLSDLAVTDRQRALVPALVSATRKQAAFKPPESVLREVLCIASVLMDETFHPDAGGSDTEEGAMT